MTLRYPEPACSCSLEVAPTVYHATAYTPPPYDPRVKPQTSAKPPIEIGETAN